MSGPALMQWDSHSSIHEAALAEAYELTELLRQCIANRDEERSLEVAFIIVEHWEARTLCHAQSEEEGLYPSLLKHDPGLKDVVIKLTRDHDLMRGMVNEIKEILNEGQALEEVLKRLDALIIVDQLHNLDEGKMIRKELPTLHDRQ